MVSLHTVFGSDTQRVGLHGVRRELIEAQSAMMNLPLTNLYLESSEDHNAYLNLMKSFYMECREQGVEGVLFGDIFLEDLKTFREELLRDSGLAPLFPLWKKDSRNLMHEFLEAGFRTLVCSADASFFSEEQTGKTIDHSFLLSLPAEVDACGENGEFHTFVYDGPIFNSPVKFDSGQVISQRYSYNVLEDDGLVKRCESSFWFQELLPRIA